MKKLSFVVLLLLSGTAFAQQYPISAFVMFGNPNENPYVSSVAAQLQKTPPLMQSAGFNWGIASVHDMAVTDVIHLLDSAAAHNIKLILADSLQDDFENLTRFYLEGDSRYFDTVNGQAGSADNNSDQPHNDSYYNLDPLETVGTGPYYMVKDAKMDPINNWATSPTSYEAYFRLKFEGSITPPSEVAEIEVYDEQTQSMIISTTLFTTNFSASDTYKTFGLSFQDPTHTYNGGQSADGIDVRVYWYGQVPVYLDDIRVDFTGTLKGHTTADLFSGNYDSQIQNMALEYDSCAALGRYWLVDEPGPYQFQTYKYVNSLLRGVSPDAAAGTGLGYTQLSGNMRIEQSNWTGDPYKRFASEADPYELTPEVAAFDSGDAQPGASNYVSTVQPELQNEVNRFSQADSNVNFTASGDFRAHLDVSSWAGTWRAPHVNEVAAEVFDALAHDAKGIDYWDYTSWPPKDNEGLVEPNTLNPINGTSSYAAYPNENRWNFIAAMNQKIEASIGPILMNPNVTFQGAYSIDGTASGSYGIVSSVSTGDPSGSQYAELGEFADNSGNQYLMVVNRRTVE